MGAMAVAIKSLKKREYTVRIITRDSTQMNRDPRRVMAHRGILSRKLTSSMIVTISSGRLEADSAVRPEASMIEDTIPWPTVNRAVISSMPWDTAAWAKAKRTKHFSTCSGFRNSVKLPQVLTTPITKKITNKA